MTYGLQMAAIEQMAGHSLTRDPIDNAKAVLLVRLDPNLRAFVLERRRRWLDWLTVTQRKWQTENTHRASRARHHDSLSIRDKYVRCHR